MDEYRYELTLTGEIPDSIQIAKTITLTTKQEWGGYSYGSAVGRIYDDGTVVSFLKHDMDHGCMEWFELLRSSACLQSRHRCLIDRKTFRESNCEEFYLMYRVTDHRSVLPTHVQSGLDTCFNVSFLYTYEILLVADEGQRCYIYETIETEGPNTYCLLDEMNNLETVFEEWASEKKHGIRRGEDGTIYGEFYDDFGLSVNVAFESMCAMLMCIHSIRIINLVRNID